MMKPYPLVFEPIFKPKIWGGRRLEQLLDKTLPPGARIGESWEIADLPEDQSIVAKGPAKGRSLGWLVREWGSDLVGDAHLFQGRFPLLIKYIDAHENLSVQVHPDLGMARRAGGTVYVKNEAWYVLEAEPGGRIFRGLNRGVDREVFRTAIDNGTCPDLLRRIDVRPGQCFYLPGGTVHTIGAGVVLAEVQTPSDVTYRVYDWDRIDPSTGGPRPLHIDQALECIDFGGRAIAGDERSHVASVWTTVTRLVTCESFIIERVRMIEGYDQEIPYAQLVVWMVLEGRGHVSFDADRQKVEFKRGDTLVMPAGLADGRLRTESDCVWLEVTLPNR